MGVFCSSARAFCDKFGFDSWFCQIYKQKIVEDFQILNILLGTAWCLVGFEGSFPCATMTLFLALFYIHICKININYFLRDRLWKPYLPLKPSHAVTQGITLWKNLFRLLSWHCRLTYHLVMILQALRNCEILI
jgi:hypothetical protein